MGEAMQKLSRHLALGETDAELVSADALTIRLLAPRVRFSLRLDLSLLPAIGQPAGFALDMPINRRLASTERAATRLGPDEWLLSGPESADDQIARDMAAALAARHYSLVDISHRQIALGVAGAKAADVISSGCPLDLSPPACPAGFATRTLLGKAEVILAKTDDAPSFEIECGRSFAAYVHDFLLEAAREFRARGVVPILQCPDTFAARNR